MDIAPFSLFLVSVQSIAQVLLLCLTGYVVAKLGIITSSIQEGLSKLIIKILMPCFLFSRIAANIDYEMLLRLWPIPVFYFFFTATSGILGVFGRKLFNLSISNTKFMVTSIMFNNVASLSLGILKGMSDTSAMQILRWGEGDDPSNSIKRGTSYILLSTLFGNLLRWSLGAFLLKKELSEEILSGETPLLGTEGISHQRRRSLFSRVVKAVRGTLNPPLCSAMLALVVGTVPFLKFIFFNERSPLATISKVMEYMGATYVPLTLITLGAHLNNLPHAKSQEILPIIAYIMSCRFIIMPIIGVVTILSTRTWYINDPMLLFVLMLFASGPTAINCMNLVQLTGTFKEEMATLLFYSYIAVAPMTTCLVM
ncbi:10844_t:CDS:2, partial [Cetraspora pellucida]